MKKLAKLVNPISIILVAASLRLLPHPPNFTPIAALAIFGGVYLSKRSALLLPILLMIISDYLLLYINPYRYPFFKFDYLYPFTALFHSTTAFVWGSLIISGLIGFIIKKHLQPKFVLAAAILASVQFFVITNFGVWLTSNLYPHNFTGLAECFIAAIPFFKNTLVGDLFFTATIFTIFWSVRRISFKKALV